MTRFLPDIPAAIKRCPQTPVMVVGGGSGAFGESGVSGGGEAFGAGASGGSEALAGSEAFGLCAVGIARIISFNVL